MKVPCYREIHCRLDQGIESILQEWSHISTYHLIEDNFSFSWRCSFKAGVMRNIGKLRPSSKKSCATDLQDVKPHASVCYPAYPKTDQVSRSTDKTDNLNACVIWHHITLQAKLLLSCIIRLKIKKIELNWIELNWIELVHPIPHQHLQDRLAKRNSGKIQNGIYYTLMIFRQTKQEQFI